VLLLQERPGMTPSQVAALWKTTRQNVWNIAQRQGIRMAGGRQKWASGL
jgi:transcriptional regulator